MKKVLITGIGGFIGSHVLDHLLVNTDWEIIGIASWKHKGIPERILDSEHYQANKDRVKIITHDLIAPFSELTIRELDGVDYILNIASESHVDRSISDPVPFIQNNINVVLNMLELAREIKPDVFIQFSTDEVYGAAPIGVDFPEWSTILPSNPYSASKAAQEAIAISYWRTYGVPVIITNTMNVCGERQDPEKFIPMCINKILKGETITIHSYPDKKMAGSRFYIHARNVADGLLHILSNLPPQKYAEGVFDRPPRYNIVGEIELDNLALAQMIHKYTTQLMAEHSIAGFGRPLKYELTDFHSTRPGHDCRYALSGKLLENLGWTPKVKFAESLQKMIQWSITNNKWLKI